MNNINIFELLGKILGVILILLSFVLVLLVFKHSYTLLNKLVNDTLALKPSVYVPLTVTFGTAVLGLSATLFTQTKIRQRERENALREKKIAIYLNFLETVDGMFFAQKPEMGITSKSSNEAAASIAIVRRQAILWGSTGVLKELHKLTKLQGKSTLEIAELIDTLYREMRKDLGLSVRTLEKNFFFTLYLAGDVDLEKLEEQSKSNITQ